MRQCIFQNICLPLNKAPLLNDVLAALLVYILSFVVSHWTLAIYIRKKTALVQGSALQKCRELSLCVEI